MEHKYGIKRSLLNTPPQAMGEIPFQNPAGPKHKIHGIAIIYNFSYDSLKAHEVANQR